MLVARMVAALAIAGVLVAAAPAAAASAAPPADRQAAARAAALAGGPVIKNRDPDTAGKCLDAYNWGAGPSLQLYPCHGGANQVFTLNRIVTDGSVELFYVYNGTYKCIDAAPGHAQQLIVWRCDGSSEQRFRQRGPESEMTLESVRFPGQCLDASDWGRGTAVVLWDCHIYSNQVWYRTY